MALYTKAFMGYNELYSSWVERLGKTDRDYANLDYLQS